MRTIPSKLIMLSVLAVLLFNMNLSLSIVGVEGELTLGQLKSSAQTYTEVSPTCMEVRQVNSTYVQYYQTQCCQTERIVYTTYDVVQVGTNCPHSGIGTATDMTISYSGQNCCA